MIKTNQDAIRATRRLEIIGRNWLTAVRMCSVHEFVPNRFDLDCRINALMPMYSIARKLAARPPVTVQQTDSTQAKELMQIMPIDKQTLRSLPIESRIEIKTLNGGSGYVKRKSRGSYVLFDNANNMRSRWGTSNEILSDIEYFINNGVLHPPSKLQWF